MASLSSMTTEQLRNFIKEQKAQGKTESTSKQVGKAVNLLKVKEPEKYGADQVESAKKSLIPSVEVQNLANLGITEVPDWKIREQEAKDIARGVAPEQNLGLSGMGTTQGRAVTPTKGQTQIPIYQEDPEMKKLQQEYETKKRAYDEQAYTINDNPFFSEATRVGKQAKLNEQKTRELGTLNDEITRRKADSTLKYNMAMDTYKLQQEQVNQNLQRLNTYIQTGALLTATAKDLAQIGVATGISQEMLQGIVNNTRSEIAAKNAPKTTVEKFVDDNGNVTIAVINSQTGQIIAQNSLSGVGATKGGAGGDRASNIKEISDLISLAVKEANYIVKGNQTINSDRYKDIRQLYASYGLGTYADFDKRYDMYVNPEYASEYDLRYDKNKQGSQLLFIGE